MRQHSDIIMPDLSGTHRKIWKFVNHQLEDGATSDEIAYSMGVKPAIIATRVWEMVQKKRLVNSGKRRATRKGRQGIIWYTMPPRRSDHEQFRMPLV